MSDWSCNASAVFLTGDVWVTPQGRPASLLHSVSPEAARLLLVSPTEEPELIQSSELELPEVVTGFE